MESFFENCKLGQTNLVRKALERGFHPKCRCSKGWSGLMYASFYGHAIIVALLLSWKAETNFSNNYRWTALMLASQKGHK